MPKALAPLNLLLTVKGEAIGFEFIDYISIKVCHNLRAPQHKTFEGVTKRGKRRWGGFMDLSYTSLPMVGEGRGVKTDHC